MDILQNCLLTIDVTSSTDFQDLKVLNEVVKGLVDGAIHLSQRIIVAIIVFFILSWIIKWIRKGVNRFLTRRKIDDTVKLFLDNVINIGLKIVLLLSIISIIGISTTSFTAILAAAGLAVGMAMKDNLSNFAGGVMLLLNKPFKNGDRILAQNMDGVVQSIGILYTTLLTSDNRTIYIPNGPLSTGTISNFSRERTRRIDKTITLKHGVDIEGVKDLLYKIFENEPRVLKEPKIFVGITNVTRTTIDVTVRVWVSHTDYGDMTVDMNELIYDKLTELEVY